jgi:hypothetical protein
MGETWEELKQDPLMRDLGRILTEGLADFSTVKLTTLPTLLGDEGSPADGPAIRRKVLEQLMRDEPNREPSEFEQLGQHTRFALTLFGVTPESRMLNVTGRRERAGEIYRPGSGIGADAIRRRPSEKQPTGGKEWNLLRSLRESLLESLDGPPAPGRRNKDGSAGDAEPPDPGVEEPGPERCLANEFFVEGYVQNSSRFRNALNSCQTLSMLGFSHNRMAVTYAAELSRLLERGGKLRVLALDPADDVVLDANLRSYAPKKPEAVRHQHEAAIATLAAIGERAADEESFQICLMNCIPPFTAYWFDEDEVEKAQVFVWLTPWRIPSPERPGFHLSATRDGAWYSFFTHQVNAMWEHFGGER